MPSSLVAHISTTARKRKKGRQENRARKNQMNLLFAFKKKCQTTDGGAGRSKTAAAFHARYAVRFLPHLTLEPQRKLHHL